MNKTVTYDPAKYKLVPFDPSNESCDVMKQHADGYVSNIGAYRAMLAAVPDQLPGVVVHSGEHIAWMWELHGWTITAHGKHRSINKRVDLCQPPTCTLESPEFICLMPLYLHPAPSQPSQEPANEDALRDAIAEALRGLYHCGRVWSAWSVGTMGEDDFSPAEEDDEIINNVLCAVQSVQTKPSQPTAEALVQAALEAAADLCDRHAEASNPMGANALSHMADCIRALSAQQIIESCKEKS